MDRSRLAKIALLLCALVGCGKIELQSDLPEGDANEMMAILMRQGIACVKEAGEEGRWKLLVPSNRFAESVETLKELGYPRETFVGIGESFQKSGLVSSPTEERIRFMHALSQDLANTISRIDGVITARVHIVLPDNDPFGEKVRPSSAAVFIKHSRNADLELHTTQIKQLVASGIEGLDYEKVTVALFPADALTGQTAEASTAPVYADVLSIRVDPMSVQRLWALFAGAIGVAGVAIVFGLYSLRRARGRSSVA